MLVTYLASFYQPSPLVKFGAREKLTEAERAYREQVEQFPVLSSEENNALAARIALGDQDAKWVMINSRLRRVVAISDQLKRRGLSFDELVAVGNESLVRTFREYNWRQFRLGPFDKHLDGMIRKSIREAIRTKEFIVPPGRLLEAAKSRDRLEHRLIQDLGRSPTSKELDALVRYAGTPYEPLRNRVDSLEDLITSGREFPSIDPNAEISAQLAGVERALKKAFRTRADSIQDVLLDEPRKSYPEIGKALGVTGTRAQQISTRAIRKIRKALNIRD